MSSAVETTTIAAAGFGDVPNLRPSPYEPPRVLCSETIRGGIYLAVRYGLGVVVSLGNMLVMTWWIGPHAYGVFVTAIGIVAFLATLARGGVDTYLVKSEGPPDHRAYGTAISLILCSSFGLGLAAAATTPLLARWYGNREFIAPYLVLLLTIPVTGLTGVPMAKLERALNFRSIAGIELGGQSAGLLVAALLAWSHPSVWAPVAGQISWQVCTLAVTLVSASLSLRPRFHFGEARKMLSYGLVLTASVRTWQLRSLVNPLLVGRFAGAEGVAFVALAVRIAEALGTFRLAAGRMAIAALARIQGRRDDFRRALERALYFQVITLGPLLCAFALVGPFILPRMAGVRWAPSLAIYPFVAAGVLINSVYNLQASALFVLGKQWIVAQSYAAHVGLLAATTLFLLPRVGVAGYGWAELMSCSAYAAIHAGIAKVVPISYRRLTPWVTTSLAGLFFLSMSPALFHAIQNWRLAK
ncbi:MAG: oligosaccharide flippase family protein [Terriglobales bacterium]